MGSKVYISCDLEGISGVIGRDQTGAQGRDYERARRAMTADVNAAIAGAVDAGASLVVVNDGHGSMQNLILEEMHPEAEVVLGSPKPLTQMEGISDEFDLAMFVGYHSRMGSPGVLSHTISGATVANVWINGVLVGETGINATLAGWFGVPVGLITGDQHACGEARELLGSVRTVEVKQAITRYSARCLHPQRARDLILAASAEAVRNSKDLRPYIVKPPFALRIQFKDSGMAESAVRVPQVEVVDAITLEYQSQDPTAAFKALRAMIGLASA